MQLEKMTAMQILGYELKTGAPHIYELDKHMQILEKHILNQERFKKLNTLKQEAGHGIRKRT